MADSSLPSPRSGLRVAWSRIDRAWAVVVLIPLCVLILAPGDVGAVLRIAGTALLGTAPFILFAVSAVAYLKATGAETLLARAFEGQEVKMVFMAALLGGLSPFCSCEVIPFIAALLAVGAPLAAVMAFWLASPLMDPAMFIITTGELGVEFSLAKTVFAVAIGIAGGFATMLLKGSPVFTEPLREKPKVGGCCGVKKPFSGTPVWRFWGEGDRRGIFRDTFVENLVFLGKWLTLAYLIEALMILYVPADLIATLLGGGGLGTILLASLVGAPAYLNGYAAPALVATLVEQGMAQGAAMSFMIAGGVSSIPAALAVWALVKPRVFTAYLGYALVGSFAAGVIWQALA